MRTHANVSDALLDRATDGAPAPATVTDVHEAHGDFVWLTLQRMGVRDADLEDRFQEVFVTVHRRLASFEHRSTLTTWLYGICLRVVAAHRRRASTRREIPMESPPDDLRTGDDPEGELAEAQRRAALATVLDGMDPDKRAVFTMAVLEEMPNESIATLLGVPVGTVYSRLHAARQDFERAVTRWKARGAR